MGVINSLIQFVTGTKALASEVNSNFETLRVANNTLDSEMTTTQNDLLTRLKADGSVNSTALQSYAPMTITNATNATPIVITSTNHNRSTGDQVYTVGVLGNTAANGTFTVTKIDANTFSLNGSIGSGTYTSGGTAYLLPQNNEHLVNKIYADNNLALKALKNGDASQTFNVAPGTTGSQAVNISQYVNSQAVNGYQKLPSGLIIQWGKAAFGTTVTLPIAFPNNNINVSLTSEGAGLNYFGVLYMTKTSFYVTRGSFNDSNQINATGYVYWIAIGN